MTEAKNSESENNPLVQPDELPLAKLALYLGGIGAVMVLLLLLVWTYYKSSTSELLREKQLGEVDKVLVEARAKDSALIDNYALIDREKGIYRIPVDQAMDLLLASPLLLMPKEQATTQPASQPASQPAQPTSQPAKEAKTTQ